MAQHKAHPAKFSKRLMPLLVEATADISGMLIDPFAGTGKIHQIARSDLYTVGVEIEPEWAEIHERTIVGDALNLPFKDDTFDGACTSPTYGNRLADHHDAKDSSIRNTYKHKLERDLHPNNSGQLQWGDEYREFHQQAWAELKRVLKPGALFVLNVSNHIRKGKEIDVTSWHINDSLVRTHGFSLHAVRTTQTPRHRQGANRTLRVGCESVVTLRAPGGA